MPDWLIWLIAAGALALAEIFSLTFVFIMLAGGAAAAALAAAVGAPAVLQVIVAIAVSVGLLGGARPVARRHMLSGPSVATGSDKLIGMDAVVLTQVDGNSGRVRLNGGEWSARSVYRDQVLPAGTVVRVMDIDGATAVVWKEPNL